MDWLEEAERRLSKSRFKPGDKFNRLTVVSFYKEYLKPLRCVALCECGTVKTYMLKAVTNDYTKSCGCLSKNRPIRPKKPRKVSPPKENAKEYRSWRKMKERCYYPVHRAYKYYGSRGIVVCEEWKNSFAQFFADMGKAPTRQHSVDRIDNNGNYCKENCRWATSIEQNQNRRDNRFVVLLGERHTISYWARRTGKKDRVIGNRLSEGWSPLEAICVPKGSTRRTPTAMEMLEALL